MFSYAVLKGLPRHVGVGYFLKSSKGGDLKTFFEASLQHFGVSLEDFNSLRGTKHLRNNAFFCDDSNASLMVLLQSSTIPEIKKLVQIIDKYPGAFDITSSDDTDVEIDDESMP